MKTMHLRAKQLEIATSLYSLSKGFTSPSVALELKDYLSNLRFSFVSAL